MSDRKHRTIVEHVPHSRLDELIGVVIHCRGRFVHDHDAAVAQQGTCQAEELPLADGEVVAVFHYGGLKNAAKRKGGGNKLKDRPCVLDLKGMCPSRTSEYFGAEELPLADGGVAAVLYNGGLEDAAKKGGGNAKQILRPRLEVSMRLLLEDRRSSACSAFRFLEFSERSSCRWPTEKLLPFSTTEALRMLRE